MVIQQKTLTDAFYETLKDVYFAEKQSVKALKVSAKAAKGASLRSAFEAHGKESAHHVERLAQIFGLLGKSPRAKTCEAMLGITKEMTADLEEFGSTEASDDVLIGCGQAIEHYEIARYGMLKAWAHKLKQPEIVALIDQTLQEEKAADLQLTKLAQLA